MQAVGPVGLGGSEWTMRIGSALVALIVGASALLAAPSVGRSAEQSASNADIEDAADVEAAVAATSSTSVLGPFDDDLDLIDGAGVGQVSAGLDGFLAFGESSHTWEDWRLNDAAWFSHDGNAWDRIDSPVFDGRDMIAAGPGGSGWVAVGNGGLVATSEDGRDWRLAGGPGQRRGRWAKFEAMTRLADGSVLILGQDRFGRDRGRYGVWRSVDGGSWERFDNIASGRERLKPRDRAGMYDVAPFGAGWVATGSDRVLVSRDGRAWRESAAPGRLRSLAVVGDQIIAADPGSRSAELWTSTDGIEWAQSEIPPLEARTPRVKALTSSPDRFVLVGAVEGETQRCPFYSKDSVYGVWTSEDGSAWDRLEVDLPQHFRFDDVAATDEAIVLAGSISYGDTQQPIALRIPAAPTEKAPPVIREGYWSRPPAPVWSRVPRMKRADAAGMARLEDGRVLIAGGSGKRATLTVIVDPETGRRERVAPLPEPATAPVLSAAPGGRVFLLPDEGQIQRFDPGTGRWRLMTARTRRPADPKDLPELAISSAAWMADGRLLVAQPHRSRFSLYDPARDRFEPMPMPGLDPGGPVATTADGETLAFTHARVWRYHTDQGWIAGAANPHLSEPFFHATPVSLADGRVAVLVPGIGRRDIDAEEVDRCSHDAPGYTLIDIYDPAADAWSTVGAFPDQTWQTPVAVQIEDGRLLINADPGLIVVEIP